MTGWLIDTMVWIGVLIARDQALARELAHHRGHDLLTNYGLQPLVARNLPETRAFPERHAPKCSRRSTSRSLECPHRSSRAIIDRSVAPLVRTRRVCRLRPVLPSLLRVRGLSPCRSGRHRSP